MKLNKVFAGDQVVLATIAADTGRDGALKAFLHVSMNQDLNADDVTAFLSEAVGLCQVGSDPCIVGVKPHSLEDTVEVAWFSLGTQFRDFIVAGLGQT